MNNKMMNANDVKKILLLDDSCFDQKAISMVLKDQGFEVECTQRVEYALRQYHKTPRPDLMILDNDLGSGQLLGLNVLDHLDKRVPVIMHSSSESIRTQAINKGACRFVQKGTGAADLINCIHSVLFDSFVAKSGRVIQARQ